MKIHAKLNRCASAIAASLVLLSAVAQAQPGGTDSRAAAIAQVQSFNVTQLQQVGPGKELDFTLTGTPHRDVSVQISGATTQLQMNEVQPGRYEGTYIVRSRDRITAASVVTARIEHDGKTMTTSLDQSVVKGARSPLEVSPKIAAFTVDADEPVRPGDELGFSLTGAPGGKARAVLVGVDRPIPLSEVSRGVYEGTYTLRRQDRTKGQVSAKGFLVVNGKESARSLERGLDAAQQERAGSARARSTQAVASCLSCGVIEAINVVEVKQAGKNVLGTIAGGVVGGVLGNQVGGGTGKDIATIAGALGGAYAGNRVQNNMDKTTEYHVVVRLESGTTQTIKIAADPGLKVGERVKLENDTVVRM